MVEDGHSSSSQAARPAPAAPQTTAHDRNGASARPSGAFEIPAGRDLSIDAARALCLPLVVVLHAMQMGVAGEPLRATNALDNYQPLAWGTWLFMIMPTFFITGGFASATSWQSVRRRGEPVSAYLRKRGIRLFAPACIAMFAVLIVSVLIGLAAGFGSAKSISFRLAEPLWFIPVYAIATALVPVMWRMHERNPIAVLTGLFVAAALVDALAALGVPGVQAINWLAVWLFAQQLGFVLFGGGADRIPKWGAALGLLGGFGVMALLTFGLGYSNDMLDNLNPPTFSIVALALVQFSGFVLLRPLISAAMRSRAALVSVGVLGKYGMTLYLWHTVAMGVVILAQHLVGLPFPEPQSPSWWATRPIWLIAVIAVSAGCCVLAPRLESALPAQRPGPMRLWAVIVATLFGVAGIGAVLALGYVGAGAVGVLLVFAATVWLLVGRPRMRRVAEG